MGKTGSVKTQQNPPSGSGPLRICGHFWFTLV